MLYEKYPQYKGSKNYFLVNKTEIKEINRNMTLEENKIRDNEILTIRNN